MNGPAQAQEDRSIIGVRSNWTCALCGDQATNQELTRPGFYQLAPPAGWTVSEHRTFCKECSPTSGRRASA